MKCLRLLLPISCLLLFGLRAVALEAIPAYAVGSAQGGYVPGGAGFAFSPQADLSVTALGFNGSGLTNGPYRVSLWSNGIPLATTVVSALSTYLNQTHYEPIRRLHLLPGTVYHLSAEGTSNSYWAGNIIQTNLAFQGFSVGGQISYLGSAYGTNSGGTFPLGMGDAAEYYVAPNFQYLVGWGTNLIWSSRFSGMWDINISSNWFNPVINSRDSFSDGMTALFDDSPGVVTLIYIQHGVAVAPAATTNNSSFNNFSFSGGGGISGSGVLVKNGASTLTLGITNAATGFTGDTLVLGGTLKIACAGALGSPRGITLVTNSATLELNGFSIGSEPVVVSGAGVAGRGAIVNNGPPRTDALQRVTVAGDTTFGGTQRWDIGGINSGSLFTGGQPWTITKVGLNQVSLVAVSQIDPALGDIDIQQGTFSLQSTTGQLGDPNRTITVRSNAVLSLNSLAAVPLNKLIVLNDRATVSSERGPSVVAGPVTLQGTNFILVATSGPAPTLTFTNVLSGAGALTKTGGGALVLAASNTYSGSTLVSTGTLALVGSGSLSASAAITLGTGTVLDLSALTNASLTLTRGQTLKGNGRILGSLDAVPESIVSPGLPIGLLTITNDVVLRGTNVMEFDKLFGTNDVLASGGKLTYGGTLVIRNAGGMLAPGDKFKLFSAASYAGAFTNLTPTIPASGLTWNASQLTNDGTLSVVLAPPTITNLSFLLVTNLIIAGTNGLPNADYSILTSTNLAIPLTNWTRVAIDRFNPYGNFIFTNSNFDTNAPEAYYLLRVP